ncbi:hypothetical protein TRFO_01568 [Tritrichomonas foetus]|uniref:BEACH domain-containing protein n=1 Tax=Tritrichomonas foetus TaxID=1144522 RepID=A0A1J4JZD2_9EUKA|nr:hypothetical protein TRFO_01568 [Tritrichomonas foetus]|eukprot:OHT03848.1 hypothetical protein TRFO_01568 [Tritrichomonas foetus]
MNNWHFLTLTFLLDEENTQVIFDIDIQNSNKLVMSPLGKPLDMNKKAIFSLGGTSIENSVNAQFPSRISNVGLFPILTNDQKIELFELGKRIVSNTLPVKEIKYIYSFKEQSSETTGFLNILTQQCGLSPLLPLFKMKSMVLRDGTKFEMSLDFILQLISRILSSFFSCQKKFYKDHGFSIIRYLIINYWLDKFTFKTYISLFSLLQNLKYEELQIHLFVEILANFSFLMKLEEKQIQLRILKNWQQSLFDSCRTIAVKTGLIKQILPAITQFFLNNDHKQHRQYLFKILRNSIESSGFDMSFIEHIMGHALICDKIEVIGEINQFLNTIIIDSKDLFNFKLESNFFIFYIYYYLHHTLEFLQIQGFQILASVYSSKIITPAFASKLVYLLIETYPETALHKQMFDFVSVNLINSHFFLPLFFYLAHKMKIDSISKFLHPSSEYAIGSHWAIWPLIYCIDHPSEQDKILTFLIHSCQNDFCQLFSQLNFVYFHNHSVLTVMSEKFITILQMMAVENPQCSQIAADFYELSQFILLFKLKIPKFIKSFSRNDMVDEITELKPGSLPNHINTLDKTKMISSISTNFNKLQQFHQIHSLNSNNTHSKIEDIVKLPDSTPLLEFYVKIKKNHLNYSWEGRTLAIKNMQMYKQKSLNEYLFFILSLCGFLEASINLSSSPEQNGFKYDGIMEFITSLNLKETEVSENKIAVQIINYHRVCSEKDPIEYSGKVTNPLVVEEKYAQFIEKNRPLRFEASIREAFKRMGLFIKNLKDRVIELENENVKLYTNDTLKLANDFKENLLYYDKKGKRLWVKLWNIMNFNCAPWFMNECEKNMYGRSTVLTPYVPTKITRSGPNFNAPAFTGKPLYQLNCDLITVVKKTPVVLTVYDNGLSIQWRKRVFRISLNWIEDIIKRPNGFEIYTVFGVTFCLGCEVNSIAKFLEILSSNLKMSFSDENCLQEYTKLWTECKISNFEYILLLNKLDGRSFHDLHNYPIVPWLTKSFKTVKTNHSSEDMVNLHLANSSLDNSILDSSITENDGSCSLNQINNSFNSPIGFNHNILDEMKINFKLDIDLRKPFKNDRVERNDILLYLSSIEPFKSFKDVGNFNDIEDLVAKTHSELIPEFFAFEKINMSLDNNLEFVYNHRKLLESPDVSSVLHHWLGRIFLKGKVHPHKNFAIFSKEFTEKCSIETRSGNFLSAKFFSFNKIEFFAKGANTIHSLTLIIHDMNENSSQNHTSLVKTNSELDTSNLGQTETRRSKNVNRKVPKSASLHQRLNFLSSRTARSDLSLSSHIKDSGEFSPSDDSNISVNNNEKKIKIERQKKDVFNFSQIDEVILSVTGGFWVVKSSDGHIFIVDSLNRLSTSSRHINISNYISNLNNPISKNYSRNFVMQLPVKNVKHFSTDGRWIAISYISSSVIDIFYDMILISSIETFENRINLLVCNDRKKMIICVVRDKLFLCDAVCGCISKVVEVKNIKKVIISDEWGFIICYVETTHKKKFLIYSENGDFLKEIYVNEKVIFMKPFKTIKGIDFMLYTLESGNAFILDIFEGNIHGPILMTFSDKIVDASYYEISRTLMTFTENGTVTFVPLELPF